MSEIVPVEKASCVATKRPFRDTRQSVDRGFELPLDAEVAKRLGQSSRYINEAALTAFRGRHFAMGAVALDQRETVLEIKIASLEGEEFAQSQSGEDRTEK